MNVAGMYSYSVYSSKRARENELFLTPETVSSLNERMVFRTSPVTSGFNMEGNVTTRIPERVGIYEGNRLLSDEQIQRFISSTVLPHHRTLVNSKGGNWSQAQTDNRPVQPNFQGKIETNHAPPINMGGLLGRPVLQGNPVFISVPQEAKRASQGRRPHFPDNPGEITGFPTEFNVPRERQGFLFPQETLVNNFSVPLSTATQVVNSNQEDISNPKCTNEGNSKYPMGMQEMTNCFPQASEREIFKVPTMTTEEVIQIPQGNGVPQETEEKFINFLQETQSLSHGTMGSKETEDDIIIVHDGTPDELFSVIQETLQEIMSIPLGTAVPQGTVEEMMNIYPGIAVPQGLVVETMDRGITIPQGKVEETTAFPEGISIPQETVVETLAFPQGTTIPQGPAEDETLGFHQETSNPQGSADETLALPQGFTIPQEIEETMAFPQGITIPKERVEIFGNPQGISVPQETLHEIMGIPQGNTVPQGTSQESMGIPQRTHGQAILTPLQNWNKCGGNSGLLFQERQSLLKSQQATSSMVSDQHQSLAMASNNPSQNDTGRSVVRDMVNPGHELNTGNCRKRRKSSSSESTFGKRQRLDLQTNGDRGQRECLSGETGHAGKMVLPKRNPEDEEFFASIEKCLELSSESSPCKEKYTFLDNLDSLSLESFPTKVIDGIYKATFESDCFLTSGDDFVTDSLSFLKQGMLDSLC